MSYGETEDNFLWRNPPSDIIFEILFRLPLKSLGRLKCVSHTWNSLISSAQTHINSANANNPPKVILISGSRALYSVDFADVNPTAKYLDCPLFEQSSKAIRVLGSCNGLLLVSQKFERNSRFLWNPLTGESKKLPKNPFFALDLFMDGHGIGYDSSTDDYIVVLLAFCGNTPKVAVYSLKTDGWRIVVLKTEVWTIVQDSYFNVYPSLGFHCNKCLHWAWRCFETYGIVAFDLSDEIFREVQLPTSFDNYEIMYHRIAIVGGCLCLLVLTSKYSIEVWMMKEYGLRESWTRLTMIDHGRIPLGTFLFFPEDSLVFATDAQSGFVVYNTKNETLRHVVIRDIPTKYTVEATYVETLVSPNHIGRREKM